MIWYRLGPRPDPCDNWQRCLAGDLSAGVLGGAYCRQTGGRVPIGALLQPGHHHSSDRPARRRPSVPEPSGAERPCPSSPTPPHPTSPISMPRTWSWAWTRTSMSTSPPGAHRPRRGTGERDLPDHRCPVHRGCVWRSRELKVDADEDWGVCPNTVDAPRPASTSATTTGPRALNDRPARITSLGVSAQYHRMVPLAGWVSGIYSDSSVPSSSQISQGWVV